MADETPKQKATPRDPIKKRLGEEVDIKDLGITDLEAVTAAIFGFGDHLRESMVAINEFSRRREFVMSNFDTLEQLDEHQSKSRNPLDSVSCVAFYVGQAASVGKAIDDLVEIVRALDLRTRLTGHPRSAFLRLERLHGFIRDRILPIRVENIISKDDENEEFADAIDGFMRLMVETATIVRKRRLAWSQAVVRRDKRALALMKMAATERKRFLERVRKAYEEGRLTQTEAQNAVAGAKLMLVETERGAEPISVPTEAFEAPVADA